MSSSESQKAGDRIHYVTGEYLPDAKSYIGFAVRKAGETDSEAVLRSFNRRLAQYGYTASRLEHLGEGTYHFWVSTRSTKWPRATEGVGDFSFQITRVTCRQHKDVVCLADRDIGPG